MISRDDRSRRLQWIFLPKDGVSGGNRWLGRSEPVMHIAKINHPYDLARLGPGIADQHVVVVGIAVNHAVAQARQDGHDFRFIERQKLLDKRAPLRVRDMFDKVPDPTGARRIPFQLAMRTGVCKRLQRRVHLAEKPAEITKKFRRVRADFGENCSIHKSKQPDKARRAVRTGNRSKQFRAAIRCDARQGQLRSALRQMRQGPALQIDKRMFPGRMHCFEHERTPVHVCQMEVVVVFARQRPRAYLKPVKFARQANRFRFGHRLSYTSLQQHAPNLIRNSRSASISEDSSLPASRPSTRDLCLLEFLSRISDGNWPIHGGEPDHRRCAAILDAAVLVVPGLAGIIANARVATHRRIVC